MRYSVILAGSVDFNDRLSHRLSCLGIDSALLPQIALVEKECTGLTRDLVASSDYLLFTSANAIRVFMKSLRGLGLCPEDLSSIRIFAVGRSTRRVLESFSLSAFGVSPMSTASSCVEELLGLMEAGDSLLFLCSDLSDRGIYRPLEKKGVRVTFSEVYETRPVEYDESAMKHAFPEDKVNIVAIPSESAARALCSNVEKLDEAVRGGIIALCIGEETERAAARLGFRNTRRSGDKSAEGMASYIQTMIGDKDGAKE